MSEESTGGRRDRAEELVSMKTGNLKVQGGRRKGKRKQGRNLSAILYWIERENVCIIAVQESMRLLSEVLQTERGQ